MDMNLNTSIFIILMIIYWECCRIKIIWLATLTFSLQWWWSNFLKYFTIDVFLVIESHIYEIKISNNDFYNMHAKIREITNMSNIHPAKPLLLGVGKYRFTLYISTYIVKCFTCPRSCDLQNVFPALVVQYKVEFLNSYT